MAAQRDLKALVQSFNPLPAGAAKPSDAVQAEALFQRLVSTQRSSQSRPRFKKPYRVAAVAAAAVVLGLLVPALAVGTGVLHLLDNEPAPPAVNKALSAPSFGLAQLTTSTGDITSLYQTNSGFGDCLYVATAKAGDAGGRPRAGFATCSNRGDDSRAISRFSQTWQRLEGHSLEFAFGKLAQDVASLEVLSSDGSVASVPLAGRYFLYELSNDPNAASFVAKDGTGAVIDRRVIENVRPPRGS